MALPSHLPASFSRLWKSEQWLYLHVLKVRNTWVKLLLTGLQSNVLQRSKGHIGAPTSSIMIQRSATHVMSVEKTVWHPWKPRELTGRQGGQANLLFCPSQFFLKQLCSVEYEIIPLGQKRAREIDVDLLQLLRNVWYRLHDGYHSGGAYSMFPFDQVGLYWDTSYWNIIADGKIKLVHSEPERFIKDGVLYKDGSIQQADIVVFTTGYMNSKSVIQAILDDDIARKCPERWENRTLSSLAYQGLAWTNTTAIPALIYHLLSRDLSLRRSFCSATWQSKRAKATASPLKTLSAVWACERTSGGHIIA
jgi:hypothetical protein